MNNPMSKDAIHPALDERQEEALSRSKHGVEELVKTTAPLDRRVRQAIWSIGKAVATCPSPDDPQRLSWEQEWASLPWNDAPLELAQRLVMSTCDAYALAHAPLRWLDARTPLPPEQKTNMSCLRGWVGPTGNMWWDNVVRKDGQGLRAWWEAYRPTLTPQTPTAIWSCHGEPITMALRDVVLMNIWQSSPLLAIKQDLFPALWSNNAQWDTSEEATDTLFALAVAVSNAATPLSVSEVNAVQSHWEKIMQARPAWGQTMPIAVSIPQRTWCRNAPPYLSVAGALLMATTGKSERHPFFGCLAQRARQEWTALPLDTRLRELPLLASEWLVLFGQPQALSGWTMLWDISQDQPELLQKLTDLTCTIMLCKPRFAGQRRWDEILSMMPTMLSEPKMLAHLTIHHVDALLTKITTSLSQTLHMPDHTKIASTIDQLSHVIEPLRHHPSSPMLRSMEQTLSTLVRCFEKARDSIPLTPTNSRQTEDDLKKELELVLASLPSLLTNPSAPARKM